MDDNLSKSSMSQTKKKMFLIKKKVGDDNIKNMKHMTQLPGLPNYLILTVRNREGRSYYFSKK